MLRLMIAFMALSAQDAPTDWDPAWFPLHEGDVWLYRQAGKDGLRLKTARLQRPGLFRLEDPDGDDYLFSSDEKGLLLHGEVKPDGALVAFEPPMGYVTPELLKSRSAESVHKTDDRSVRATSSIVGMKDGALVTSFTYQAGANRRFTIDNKLVKGVGPVRRKFRMAKDDGSIVFESTFDLVAARVGGRVFPAGSEDTLARELFRHAYEHREVFGPKFPGFTCRVKVTESGPEKEAALDVSADGKIVSLGDLPRWAESEVRSMIGHRKGASFDERTGKTALKYGGGEGGRVGVTAEGDSMGSQYEVSDGILRVVSRLDEGKQRFRIEVREVQWTSRGRYLPLKFDIVVGSSKREVTDAYASLADDWVPKTRTIRSGENSKVLEFLDLKSK